MSIFEVNEVGGLLQNQNSVLVDPEIAAAPDNEKIIELEIVHSKKKEV